MQPFKKKSTVRPFQEIRQEYGRSEVHEVPNPIGTESVCPLCCDIFPLGTLSADYPICPDCSSEGIDSDVVPLADFLDRTTVDKLNDSLRHWETLGGGNAVLRFNDSPCRGQDAERLVVSYLFGGMLHVTQFGYASSAV